jgi:hypothetical protein
MAMNMLDPYEYDQRKKLVGRCREKIQTEGQQFDRWSRTPIVRSFKIVYIDHDPLRLDAVDNIRAQVFIECMGRMRIYER